MRTKVLVAAAALLAAGALSSMAQSNVYSLNVVGYVNVTLNPGFTMIGNPLDLDGTGNNNTLVSVLGTNLPNLTRAYAFVPPSSFPTATLLNGNWTGAAAVNPSLNNGGGIFVSIPGSTPQTVTIVGNVKQGTLTTTINQTGYGIYSSQVPQAGLLKTDLGYTPANLDRVYQYINPTGYGPAHTYVGTTWSGGEPNLAVAEAFWIQGHTGSAWSRTFNVQ